MNRHIAILLFLLVDVCLTSTAFASNDPCTSSTAKPEFVQLTLKKARLSAGTFIGEFEIKNGATTPLTIPANVQHGTFYLRKPEFWVEYKSLANSWEPLPDIPRDNINADQLRIEAKSIASFSALLMSERIANLNASEFRAVIRHFDSELCIFSVSFQTTPVRARAEGLETTSASRQD